MAEFITVRGNMFGSKARCWSTPSTAWASWAPGSPSSSRSATRTGTGLPRHPESQRAKPLRKPETTTGNNGDSSGEISAEEFRAAPKGKSGQGNSKLRKCGAGMPTPGNSIREFHAPKSRTGNPKPLKQGPERRTAGRPRGNPGPEPRDGEYREEKNRPAAPATRSGRRGGAASGTQPSSPAQTRRGTAEVRSRYGSTDAQRRASADAPERGDGTKGGEVMAEFITVRGNMFDSKAQVLVNPVNCVGVMGTGLAKQFKARYPEMFREYRKSCRRGLVKTGEVTLHAVPGGRTVANLPAKEDRRNPSLPEYADSGLLSLAPALGAGQFRSAAVPALGAGAPPAGESRPPPPVAPGARRRARPEGRGSPREIQARARRPNHGSHNERVHRQLRGQLQHPVGQRLPQARGHPAPVPRRRRLLPQMRPLRPRDRARRQGERRLAGPGPEEAGLPRQA